MTIRKFCARARFNIRWTVLLAAMGSLSIAVSDPVGGGLADRSASVAAMREAMAQIQNSALTPEEKVSRMTALREEQMKLLPAAQAEVEPSPSAARPAAPATQAEENLAALRETQATARTPEEAVRLLGELFRVNAEAYALPAPVGDPQSLLAARSSLAGQSGPAAESRDAILEILATARRPEESVQLMNQFFTLNRETLLSLVAPQPDSTPLPANQAR
jgi:hypothetical protein